MQDFNSTWFNLIGNTVIGAMIIGIFMPIGEHFVTWFLESLEKWADRGCCPKSKYDTKKTGIAEYVQVYGGIDHQIHYGYSTLLVIVFVTFLFGFGIPILFPIAALSILVLYCTEKYALYYIYKEPPMYDSSITEEILSTLRLGPLLYFACGYWMLTN